MPAGFEQILAIERTVDRVLAGFAATRSANGMVHAWTMAARLARLAESALHSSYRIIRAMPRTDIYLKIVVEHERDEKPEKLAEEICRRIEKLYGVRYAEVSNVTRREEG
jgi:hypothetical protein